VLSNNGLHLHHDVQYVLLFHCLGFLARSVNSKSASLVNHPAAHFLSLKKQVADRITWHEHDIIIAQIEKCVIGYWW